MTLDSRHSVSLARSYALPGGARVRLRLPQPRDLGAIRALLSAAGDEQAELETRRLVRADPRRRVVVCATALLHGTDTIVGVGAIEIGADRPDLLCVRESMLAGLPELLSDALRSRVAAIAGRNAA